MSSATKIPMMTITTTNSIKVNPLWTQEFLIMDVLIIESQPTCGIRLAFEISRNARDDGREYSVFKFVGTVFSTTNNAITGSFGSPWTLSLYGFFVEFFGEANSLNIFSRYPSAFLSF